MDFFDFREYILSLHAVEECTPFDETTLVYKIAGRMFACATMENSDHIVIHHTPDDGDIMREQHSEITPAWHFNKRHWSDVRVDGDLPETFVKQLIFNSYIYTIHHNVTPKARREELLKVIKTKYATR